MNQQIDDEMLPKVTWRNAEDGTRLLHFCIDRIAFLFLARLFIHFMIQNTNLLNWATYDADRDSFPFGLWMCICLLFWLYYFLQETFLTGKTIGKFITRCQVVTLEGLPPGPKSIAIRSIARLIPFNALSIFNGAIWHDRFAKTTVVQSK
jgi:uncharacterized RDD family membrane protein YckC